MTQHMRDQEMREEGRREGIKEGRKVGLQEGIREGRKVGLQEGIKEGDMLTNSLYRYLMEHGLTDEMEQAFRDREFRLGLIKKYGISMN